MGSLGSLLPSLQPLLSLPLHCLQGRIVMWPIISSHQRKGLLVIMSIALPQMLCAHIVCQIVCCLT